MATETLKTPPWSAVARIGLLIGLGILAIAPWIKNHRYLRDFMDYGLVMAGIGRIERGEAPYEDFVTPIQSGFLHLNWVAEKIGGGTYLGLAYGGLGLILVAGTVLTWLLSRRLPLPVAALFSWSIVIATATQHTIIWHNSLGVICLAVAIWAAALAPAWRKDQIIVHVLMLGALWLGGINKLNFHLLALTGVLGFLMRHALLHPHQRRDSLKLAAAAVGAGTALPLITELTLSGASLGALHYNVIALAGPSRAEYLTALVDWDNYLRPIHDYYGDLPVPQFGLWFVVSILGVVGLAWKCRSKRDRIFLIIAGLGCVVAAVALLVTNQEIAYVAGGACLTLGVSLVLAFGASNQVNRASWGWLGIFTLINTLPAWSSAWKGERSQFGHSMSMRSDYVELATLKAEFDYLKGVRIPPEAAESYDILTGMMPPADENGDHAVFYATGVEWLQRIWPTRSIAGLPLWMHDETSYQPAQERLLYDLIRPPPQFDVLVESVPWGHWPGQTHVPLYLFTSRTESGAVLRVYRPIADLMTDNDAFRLINRFGANFEPHLLRLDETQFLLDADDRLFFGTTSDTTTFGLDWSGNTIRASGVLVRTAKSHDDPVAARFRIEVRAGEVWTQIVERRLELSEAETQQTFELSVDTNGRDIRFRTEIEGSDRSDVAAGWYCPVVLHAQAQSGPPPPLMKGVTAVSSESPNLHTAINRTTWTPDSMLHRGGTARSNGLLLSPGDQVWLRADHPLRNFGGTVERMREPGISGRDPTVRVVWYKGGRLQIALQEKLSSEAEAASFSTWSGEPEGWFGILVDPAVGAASVLVSVDQAERLP